jgi:enoyl-CoA hydratase/carnithine racemase
MVHEKNLKSKISCETPFSFHIVKVLVEKRGEGVLVITLNRPAKRNAIDMEMYGMISRTLRQAERDDDIQASIQ